MFFGVGVGGGVIFRGVRGVRGVVVGVVLGGGYTGICICGKFFDSFYTL